MIQAQADKTVIVQAPSTGVSTSAITAAIDTLGASYVQIQVLGTQATAAGTNKLDALAVASGTSSTGPWTNISGLVGTTNSTAASGEFVIPGHSVTNQPFLINLGCVPPARWLRVTYDAPSTTYDDIVVIARLQQLNESANSTTEAGSIANVYV